MAGVWLVGALSVAVGETDVVPAVNVPMGNIVFKM